MAYYHVTADAFRGLVSDSPGAGVAGGEPPDLGAVNRTWVFPSRVNS